MRRSFVPALALALVAGGLSLASAAPLPQAESITSPAQPALRGRILDATGAPVVRARVAAHQAGKLDVTVETRSNWRGEFVLTLPAGDYRLAVEADGFTDLSERITMTTAPAATLDLVLQVAGFAETVQVDATAGGRVTAVGTATKTDTPLRSVPQAVSVVTSDMMAEQRMTSMADVVRFMPGVGMAQGEGNRDTPVLRGNSSTSDFFIDGVRDDVQYFRDVYNLERVEALKGPNAMIFGRGGAGGVINRVTRQAHWGRTGEFSAQLGSFGNRRLTGDYGVGLTESVAVRVTGMFEHSDTYRAGVGVERYGAQPSIAFRLGPATTVRASLEHFHDERTADRGVPSFGGRPVDTPASTFFGDPDASRADATVNLLAAVLDHEVSDRITLRNRLSYGLYDKFYQNVYPGAVNAAGTLVTISGYNNRTDRANLFNQTDLIVRQRTGGIGHTILVGAEFGRQVTDNFRSTGYFTGVGPNVTSIQVPLDSPTVSAPVTFRQSATDANNHGIATVAALYVQDQVQLSSRLEAVAGLRFDAFDLDFTNNRTGEVLTSQDRLLSPRAGLIYRPIEPVSVYTSYSLTYVPRGGDQLTSLSLTTQTLEPETFRNYEAGVKWDATRSLGVSAAVYRLDRGNVAIPDPSDTTRLLLVDAQRTKGIELEMNGRIGDALHLTAGYAWQDGRITRAISSSAAAGATLAQVPEHSFSAWARYAIAPRWSAAAGVIHTDRIFAATTNTVVLPSWTRVDGGVFFDVTPKVRAQVNVENLFDADYFASAHNNNNITPGSPRAIRFALTTRF